MGRCSFQHQLVADNPFLRVMKTYRKPSRIAEIGILLFRLHVSSKLEYFFLNLKDISVSFVLISGVVLIGILVAHLRPSRTGEDVEGYPRSPAAETRFSPAPPSHPQSHHRLIQPPQQPCPTGSL